MHTLTWPLTEPIVVFAIIMLILLLVPIGMQRLKLPGVVGLILTGLILGPNMLYVLERTSFELFGAVGLQYIVFSAGLELDLAGFKRVRAKAISFGLASFLIPFGLGTAAAMTLLQFPLMPALLLGSVFGSHTLLAYPVASKLGLAKHEAVTVTVGATIVTDVSVLLVLAIVAKSANGDIDAWFWGQLIVGAAVFLGLVLLGLPRLARWFFMKRDADGVEAFLFVLASVFIAAWVAELTGLVSIIGSFMAGIALNRLIPATGPLANRIHFVGNTLLVPFFLISVGMLANLWVLLEGFWSWAVAIVMTVTVLAGKWIAAMLGGLVLRYTKEDRTLMFGLSVPQAAATLAAVMIGYKLKLFDEGVLNGTIIMIIVTCIVGPSLVERAGRLIARRIAEDPQDHDEAPQRILVPLANPESATQLLDIALLLRDDLSDQPIYPLAVVNEADDAETRLAGAEKLLATAVLHGAGAHVPISPVTRIHRNISHSILSTARDTRSSHLIAGWDGQRSGSGFGRTFGRVLDPVVTHGDCALMVCYQRQPVSTLARVIVTLAPYADRHPGFGQQMHDIKLLVQRLSAKMVLLLPGDAAEDVAKRIKHIKPAVPTSLEKMASWPMLLGAIAEHIRDDDLLVFITARPGTIAYDTKLDRLPSELARRFPELDFIVSYPAEAILTENGDGPRQSDFAVDMTELTFEPALRQIVEAFPDLPENKRKSLHRALVAKARSSLTSLAPGVLLIDLHDPSIPASCRVIARSTEGVTFPHSEDEVRMLLLMLSSSERPQAMHLSALSRMALALRRHGALDRLRQDPDLATLGSILEPNAPTPPEQEPPPAEQETPPAEQETPPEPTTAPDPD